MALITMPLAVIDQITRSDISLGHPGQVVLTSLYGSGSQVLGRGPGYWNGRLQFAQTDKVSDGARAALDLFFAQLQGAINTFEAPLFRPSKGTLAAGTVLTVDSVAGSVVNVTGASAGLVAGDYVSIAERLYQLSSDLTGGAFSFEPPLPPATGDQIRWENVTCFARLSGRSVESGITSARSRDFSGGWSVEWEESI